MVEGAPPVPTLADPPADVVGDFGAVVETLVKKKQTNRLVLFSVVWAKLLLDKRIYLISSTPFFIRLFSIIGIFFAL